MIRWSSILVSSMLILVTGATAKRHDLSYERNDFKQVVLDYTTKLMWQDNQEVASNHRPWLNRKNAEICMKDGKSKACYDTSGKTATTYCQELRLGGYSDWRLPTIGELEGLIDKSQIPTIFIRAFYNLTPVENSFYWSLTTSKRYSFDVGSVYFMTGSSAYSNKHATNFVRCVRKHKSYR